MTGGMGRGGGGGESIAHPNNTCISNEMKLKLGSSFICVMKIRNREKIE